MYQPIEPPPPPGRYQRQLDVFDRIAERWAVLREALGKKWAALAAGDENRRAAIETGAIEGLYDLEPGVTETLVRHGLDSEAGRTLDHETFDLISAQDAAVNLVIGSIGRDEAVTSSLIRELHAAVTAKQATYVARDQLDRQVRRTLNQGAFKDDENSVTLPDGSMLYFAPPLMVEEEMDRLVDIMKGLTDAPWAYRAAVGHHLLTHIHPFQDGNGRTARLLATHQLLRGGLPGLVVQTADRVRYRTVLREADEGELGPFLGLLSAALMASLRRIERRAFEPEVRDGRGPLSVAKALAALQASAETDLGIPALGERLVGGLTQRLEKEMRPAIEALGSDNERTSIGVETTSGNVRVSASPDMSRLQEFRVTALLPDDGRLLHVPIALYKLEAATSGAPARLFGGFDGGRQLDIDLVDPDWPEIEHWLSLVLSDALVRTQ